MQSHYVTAAAYAAMTGLSLDMVRNMAKTGALKGAVRVGRPGSPWAIPHPANTEDPAPVGAAGSSADKQATVTGAGTSDLMSSRSRPLTLAREVSDRARLVNTRPARALGDAVYAIAAVASAHMVDRDGRCARCGWTYPCPDRVELVAALEAAHVMVVSE